MNKVIDVLSRLRVIHLPSLIKLLANCHSVLVSIYAETHRESNQSSKTYLAEFVSLLESLISKVGSLDKQEFPFTNLDSLLFLESSIITSVLPLGVRLLRQQTQRTTAAATSSSPLLAPTTTLALKGDSVKVDHPSAAASLSCYVSSPRKVIGRSIMETLSSQQLFHTAKRAKTVHNLNAVLNQPIEFSLTAYTDVSKRELLSASNGEVHRRRPVSSLRMTHTATYHCDNCSGIYQMAVQHNPWWAVYSHPCPHCSSLQVPRLDIELPGNALEHNPVLAALYGQGCISEEDTDLSDLESDSDNSTTSTSLSRCPSVLPALGSTTSIQVDLPSTASDSSSSFESASVVLSEETSRSLLRLMQHARHCVGTHCTRGVPYTAVCRSTKLIMLHLRDCLCYTEDSRAVCSMPWCRPCQPLLQHITHCAYPATCSLCVVH